MSVLLQGNKHPIANRVLNDPTQIFDRPTQFLKISQQEVAKAKASKQKSRQVEKNKLLYKSSVDKQALIQQNLELKQVLNTVLNENIKLRTKVFYLTSKINKSFKNDKEDEYFKTKELHALQNAVVKKKDHEIIQSKKVAYYTNHAFLKNNRKKLRTQLDNFKEHLIHEKINHKTDLNQAAKASSNNIMAASAKKTLLESKTSKEIDGCFYNHLDSPYLRKNLKEGTESVVQKQKIKEKGRQKVKSQTDDHQIFHTIGHKSFSKKRNLIININLSKKKITNVNLSYLNEVCHEDIKAERKVFRDKVKSSMSYNIGQMIDDEQIKSPPRNTEQDNLRQQKERYKRLYQDMVLKMERNDKKIERLQSQYSKLKLQRTLQQSNRRSQGIKQQTFNELPYAVQALESIKRLLYYRMYGYKFNYNDLKEAMRQMQVQQISYQEICFMLVDKPFYLNVEAAKVILRYLFDDSKPGVESVIQTNQLLSKFRDLIIDFDILGARQEIVIVKHISESIQANKASLIRQIKQNQKLQGQIDETSLRSILSRYGLSQDEILYILSQLSINSLSMQQLKYAALFETLMMQQEVVDKQITG